MWLFTQERDCIFRHGISPFALHQQERYNFRTNPACELLYKYVIESLDSNVLKKRDIRFEIDARSNRIV